MAIIQFPTSARTHGATAFHSSDMSTLRTDSSPFASDSISSSASADIDHRLDTHPGFPSGDCGTADTSSLGDASTNGVSVFSSINNCDTTASCSENTVAACANDKKGGCTDNPGSAVIDTRALRSNNRKLSAGLIAPPTEEVVLELANEHAAEPIKSMDDILRISEYLISNGRYRDNMLFILGINFGLRISDLLQLRFTHLITDGFVFRENFAILEKKTKNTRRVRKNRYITINDAVIDAVTLYLENTPNVKLSDFLFRSESNRSTTNVPMHRNSVDRILKGIAEDLGLTNKMSTHSLRKTFAYHQMVMSNNDPRKLLLLQKMFNHSSAAQTLDYIGITGEEIEEAYRQLNLGSRTGSYLVDSTIFEAEANAS